MFPTEHELQGLLESINRAHGELERLVWRLEEHLEQGALPGLETIGLVALAGRQLVIEAQQLDATARRLERLVLELDAARPEAA